MSHKIEVTSYELLSAAIKGQPLPSVQPRIARAAHSLAIKLALSDDVLTSIEKSGSGPDRRGEYFKNTTIASGASKSWRRLLNLTVPPTWLRVSVVENGDSIVIRNTPDSDSMTPPTSTPQQSKVESEDPCSLCNGTGEFADVSPVGDATGSFVCRCRKGGAAQ
jgi:hypothetical protein